MKQAHTPEPAHDIERIQPTVSDRAMPVAGAAKEVVESVKEHARDVGGEAMQHGRNLAGHMGERLSGEVRSQNDRLASGLQKLADDLDKMSDGTGSVATTVVQQLSGTSRQAASYLEEHGPEGLLREVQEFARRRPGAFLVGAAVAGFVAGRLGKGLLPSASTTASTTAPTTASTTAPTTAAGTSPVTGVAFTPTGETRPTPTGAAPMPMASSAAVPTGSASRSGAGS